MTDHETMTRTNGSPKEHAADLGRAMIEQARVGDAYERAVGTPAEQSAFVRLERAGREVTRRDQVVRDDVACARRDLMTEAGQLDQLRARTRAPDLA